MNPNTQLNLDSRPVTNFERVKATLYEYTPEIDSFEDTIYPAADVKKDLRQLSDYKKTKEYQSALDQDTRSKIMEQTFIEHSGKSDWFGDEDLYGEDEAYYQTVIVPTSEVDDYFNHVDAIAVFKNRATDQTPLPVALDFTYNVPGMNHKMSWRHVYGKKQTAPAELSEFGDSYIGPDKRTGETGLHTRRLPERFSYGLKIPGFATAKYFEDTDSFDDPILPKGRIPLMPRFIVGYEADENTVDTLYGGTPDSAFRRNYGQQEFEKRRAEFSKVERHAKWCSLIELNEQSKNLVAYLDNLTPEETQFIPPRLLQDAKHQAATAAAYFGNAFKNAKAKLDDPSTPDRSAEQAAYASALSDEVCQSIISESQNVFLHRYDRTSAQSSGHKLRKLY